MAIRDIYNEINGWLDYNMDWGNPNPYQAQYWVAIMKAIQERQMFTRTSGITIPDTFSPFTNDYLSDLMDSIYSLIENTRIIPFRWGNPSFPQTKNVLLHGGNLTDSSFIQVPVNQSIEDMKSFLISCKKTLQDLRYYRFSNYGIRGGLVTASVPSGTEEGYYNAPITYEHKMIDNSPVRQFMGLKYIGNNYNYYFPYFKIKTFFPEGILAHPQLQIWGECSPYSPSYNFDGLGFFNNGHYRYIMTESTNGEYEFGGLERKSIPENEGWYGCNVVLYFIADCNPCFNFNCTD